MQGYPSRKNVLEYKLESIFKIVGSEEKITRNSSLSHYVKNGSADFDYIGDLKSENVCFKMV